tara:strand:+ start:116 stop:766 length:651 start_codon:yes stop_codon:yes gene_type:complete
MKDTEKITIKRFDTIEMLNEYVVNKLVRTIKSNPEAKIMLSGGNTPRPIYEKFDALGKQSNECSFVSSDERLVPVNNKLSNEGMLRKYLKNYDNSQILSLHDKEIKKTLREIPVYDIALLGMGLDGHFASIFPEMDNLNEALFSNDPICEVSTGVPDVPRVSLTMSEILKAKIIMLLVADQEKLRLFEGVLQAPNEKPISKLITFAEGLEALIIKN